MVPSVGPVKKRTVLQRQELRLQAKVESDANGCAVTLSTGKSNGIVRDGGSAGDKVRMTLR
jgi:hypothetical protein